MNSCSLTLYHLNWKPGSLFIRKITRNIIKLKYYTTFQYQALIDCKKYLKKLRRNQSFNKSFKHLQNYSYNDTFSHIMMTKAMKFAKIKSINFKISSKLDLKNFLNFSKVNTTKFLKNLAIKLQNINEKDQKLIVSSIKKLKSIECLCMPLREIKATEYFHRLNTKKFQTDIQDSRNIHHWFNSLTHIDLKFINDSFPKNAISALKDCKNLKSLSIYSQGAIFNEDIFEALSQLMPSYKLKSIELVLMYCNLGNFECETFVKKFFQNNFLEKVTIRIENCKNFNSQETKICESLGRIQKASNLKKFDFSIIPEANPNFNALYQGIIDFSSRLILLSEVVIGLPAASVRISESRSKYFEIFESISKIPNLESLSFSNPITIFSIGDIIDTLKILSRIRKLKSLGLSYEGILFPCFNEITIEDREYLKSHLNEFSALENLFITSKGLPAIITSQLIVIAPYAKKIDVEFYREHTSIFQELESSFLVFNLLKLKDLTRLRIKGSMIKESYNMLCKLPLKNKEIFCY